VLNEVEKSRLAELEQAFELFNETSLQLTHAYEALQHQVAELQVQLARSDQEKRKVADRLSRLLNLLPAGVIVLNAQDQVVEMNPSAEAILGADALHRSWVIVLRNVFLTATDAGELTTHDERIFQLSETPLDEALGRILLIQDVTSARHLQEHINRHQRLSSMGEMAASLAHQIRTPLSSALLYVSQMNSISWMKSNAANLSTRHFTACATWKGW
jgi:Signal transduction histidine kinase involved in nitrogen fixation and metabolism regulation